MSSRLSRQRWVRAALCGAAVFSLASEAFAQAPAPPPARAAAAAAPAAPTSAAKATKDGAYKVLIPFERMVKERTFASEVKINVGKVLRGNTSLSASQRPFDAYYALYYFPLMTQVDDASLKELPAERMKFLKNDLEGCRVPEVHAHLVRLTFDEMLAITRDPEFHPAVRYNALTIIASLNDVDAVRLTSAGAVPEPMARALPVLLEEYRRPENSDALKVAALIGLSRHLEWDPHRPAGSAPIPAALRTEVLNEMLALAEAKTTVPGRSAEGHLWFRRRAVEALGLASVAKPEPAVAAALDKMLKDDSEPLPLRFAVAAAMGRMKMDPAAKVDVTAVAKELGYLAMQACDSELTRVSTLKKEELERTARLAKGVSTFTGSVDGSSSGGGVAIDSSIAGAVLPEMSSGPAGGGSGLLKEDPKAYRFDPVRRRIRYYLYCVQLGLNGGVDKNPTNGIAGVAKAPKDVQLIADVDANLDKLAKVIEVDAVDMAQLDKDLRKVMKDLEKFARKAAPPPAPADLPAGDLPAAPPAGDAPAGDVPAPAVEAAAAGAAAAGAAAEDVPAAGAAPAGDAVPAAPGAVAAPAVP